MNKSVQETKKERDKIHKELELIEVYLQGKRARTHDDTGDGHDMNEEVDELDLSVGETSDGRKHVCKTIGMCHSGLSTINRSLTQRKTGSCFTSILVLLVGLHTRQKTKACYRSMGTTGEPVPVGQRDVPVNHFTD